MITSSEVFNIILNDTIQNALNVLGQKAEVYARDDDRLHNFRKAESIINLVHNRGTPAYAAWCIAAKQLATITDILDNPESFGKFEIDEKFGDMINYLILMKAIVYELNAGNPGW